MPVVRDGSNRVTEYRVDPVGSPPGPVEHAIVGPQRMAEIAAERAAAARPAAPAAPNLGRRVGRPRTTPEQRQARTEEFLEAVRMSDSHAEAGKKLGLSGARIAQVISELRRANALPIDVDNLLRARSRQRPLALAEVELTPSGRVVATALPDAITEPIAQEAPVSATNGVDLGTTEPSPSAEEVATPPGLHFAGEDRCPFARKLDATLVMVCDREPHEDGHRGRLIQIGLQDVKVLGHAAVPA